MNSTIRKIDFSKELRFRTSKSGGKGGQHVNKVETRVELIFDIEASNILRTRQKEMLCSKLENRLKNGTELRIVADSDRSQLKNKKIALERFYALLESGLRIQKKRKETKLPKSVKEKRLKNKKKKSEIKKSRGKSIDY